MTDLSTEASPTFDDIDVTDLDVFAERYPAEWFDRAPSRGAGVPPPRHRRQRR